MFTTYEPSVFDTLNNFNKAKEELKNNTNALNEIGKIICQHNLQDVLGVSLLHKHFAIQPNEKMVVELSDEKKYISPKSDIERENLVPYMWKLGYSEEVKKMIWYPIEFITKDQAVNEENILIESLNKNTKILDEIANKLQEMGLAEVYGIHIIQKNTMKFDANIVNLETTDSAKRLLTVSQVSAKDVDFNDLTETRWEFIPKANDELGIVPEKYTPNTWCLAHCTTHCRGHY